MSSRYTIEDYLKRLRNLAYLHCLTEKWNQPTVNGNVGDVTRIMYSNSLQGGFPPWLLKNHTAEYSPRFRTLSNTGESMIWWPTNQSSLTLVFSLKRDQSNNSPYLSAYISLRFQFSDFGTSIRTHNTLLILNFKLYICFSIQSFIDFFSSTVCFDNAHDGEFLHSDFFYSPLQQQEEIEIGFSLPSIASRYKFSRPHELCAHFKTGQEDFYASVLLLIMNFVITLSK